MKKRNMIAVMFLFSAFILFAESRENIAVADIQNACPSELKTNDLSYLKQIAVEKLVKVKNYRIVERDDAVLKKMFAEFQFQNSGLTVSDGKAIEVGKIENCQYIFYSSVISCFGRYSYSAKIVKNDNGEILKTGSFRVKSTEEMCKNFEPLFINMLENMFPGYSYFEVQEKAVVSAKMVTSQAATPTKIENSNMNPDVGTQGYTTIRFNLSRKITNPDDYELFVIDKVNKQKKFLKKLPCVIKVKNDDYQFLVVGNKTQKEMVLVTADGGEKLYYLDNPIDLKKQKIGRDLMISGGSITLLGMVTSIPMIIMWDSDGEAFAGIGLGSVLMSTGLAMLFSGGGIYGYELNKIKFLEGNEPAEPEKTINPIDVIEIVE